MPWSCQKTKARPAWLSVLGEATVHPQKCQSLLRLLPRFPTDFPFTVVLPTFTSRSWLFCRHLFGDMRTEDLLSEWQEFYFCMGSPGLGLLQ